MGVYYAVKDACYEDLLQEQIEDAIKQRGEGTLETLLDSGDTYIIESEQDQHGLQKN